MNVHVDDELAARLRQHLAAQLAADGDLRTQAWRNAVETVPREVFLGDVFYRRHNTPQGTLWEPITPQVGGPSEWLTLAYENTTWVTQLDGYDAAPPPGPVTGEPTSSSTLPGLVVSMLEDLQVEDGDKVLEIGTGTGYSTALLCRRLGDGRVTTVEVAPGVGGRARDALQQAGYAPTVVIRDGLTGWPYNAPYDRIIATCSVRYIPAAWLTQTRPGGLILAPLSGWLYGSALARLTVTGLDTAEGKFLPGTVSFMPARPHAAPSFGELPPHDDGQERPARFGGELFGEWTPLWIAQLAAPGAQYMTVSFDGEPAMHCVLDQEARSWAWLIPDEHGGWLARQGGRHKLWDQIETTLAAWHDAGRPPQQEFRIGIAGREQRVYLPGTPGLRWVLPA